MSTEFNKNYFILPNDTPICALDSQKAFDGLTDKERLYAYYLSQASWYGSLIVLHQTSPESPLIFIIFHKLFKRHSLPDIQNIAMGKAGMTEEEFKAFILYAAGFYANMGNYKSFGDTKFVPNVDQTKFEALIRNSEAYAEDKEGLEFLLKSAIEKIYGLDERERRLGMGKQGITTYLSSNIEKEDTDLVRRYMDSRKIEGWNTRLFKTIDSVGKAHYEIRLASIEGGTVLGPEEFENASITVTRGDYSPLLVRANKFLELAKEHAANENQVKMLENYIEHFKTGKLDLHKDGSRFWIKDKAPAVESYIGFIENYRDPAGGRSEFEGFVAVVNRSMSEKFSRLVDNAEKFIAYLPWDASYEKDKFLRPDFTSLDVLSFGSGGVPNGINIPNYDDIRQHEGFKNVSLGNVSAVKPNTKINFISKEDEDFVKGHKSEAFELQVALHELLGHGSGKLFCRHEDGTFNFNVDEVKDLETDGKVTSWYEPGETYSSKFGGGLSNAYEECRAEAVGYFLSTFPDIRKTFGFEDEKISDDIKYINWLDGLRLGLVALEYYSPERKTWGQAHCHARFVLLMVAIEAGNDFVNVTEMDNAEDGKPDLLLTVDRTKIDSVGKPAYAAFLKKLQLYKATGIVTKAKALFDHYSAITTEILHWRQVVIDRRVPRRLLVLGNTILQDGHVTLKTYLETPDGLVLSNIERYLDEKIEDEILSLWKKDEAQFK